MSWRRQVTIASIVALLVVPVFVPELLFFPYKARAGEFLIESEQPIDQAVLNEIVARSTALVQASPLAQRHEPRRVFLTTGGWRWTWLAVQNRDAFAISRPLRETIVVNRNNLAADRVRNSASIGGERTLSGVLTHEVCHGMLRHHFSLSFDRSKPAWLREGYCDYVARESSLSDAEAAKLKAQGVKHPALPYYDGRKRVAAELKANGNDVDALFAMY